MYADYNGIKVTLYNRQELRENVLKEFRSTGDSFWG